jgi:hypothetical protein
VRRKLRARAGEQLNVPDDLDASLAGALRDRMTIEREAGGDDEGVELGEVGLIEIGDDHTLSLKGEGRVRVFGVGILALSPLTPTLSPRGRGS